VVEVLLVDHRAFRRSPALALVAEQGQASHTKYVVFSASYEELRAGTECGPSRSRVICVLHSSHLVPRTQYRVLWTKEAERSDAGCHSDAVTQG